jgi:uncharacterized membrane-anchored protein
MKRWWAGLCCALMISAAGAQSGTQPTAQEAAFEAALKAAQAVKTVGPADAPIKDQAVLKVQPGHVFFPAPQAAALVQAMGNSTDDSFVGLIVPATEGDWMMAVRYEPSGYIQDGDAKDWKADELLESIRAGTEEANKERAKHGFNQLEVLGWAEAPAYDPATHRLVWALKARDKGANAGPADALGVNYNTYALGRDGYVSVNLVTRLSDLPAQKPLAHAVLANLEFNPGKRYADFNASTDRVAEYGLGALVAGVAAKKLGLFAVIAAFFAKFFKVILLAVAGVGAGVYKWRKRKAATVPSV